jgi:hypothetical protein
MSDNVENLILEHLKGFRNEFRDFRTKYDQDIDDIKHRLTTIERGQGGMKHDAADQYDIDPATIYLKYRTSLSHGFDGNDRHEIAAA